MDLIRDLQLVSTLMLCGLIWTIQLVHYPAFRFVDAREFQGFHRFHSTRITLLVGVLMPVELLAAAVLAIQAPSPEHWVGIGLVAAIWASTAFLQVPAHTKLAGGFDRGAHAALVRTNWIRTAAWSVRAALVTAL